MKRNNTSLPLALSNSLTPFDMHYACYRTQQNRDSVAVGGLRAGAGGNTVEAFRVRVSTLIEMSIAAGTKHLDDPNR